MPSTALPSPFLNLKTIVGVLSGATLRRADDLGGEALELLRLQSGSCARP